VDVGGITTAGVDSNMDTGPGMLETHPATTSSRIGTATKRCIDDLAQPEVRETL
jgi:hypothetical protein